MQNTYVDIMVQSLKKKIKILEEIKRINLRQRALLEDDKSDADEFDKTVEEKSAQLEQMELLDSGFDKLFERVREELQDNKDAHKENIREMQNCIRKITDYSMEIQAQEARNKELMMRKFATIRERAKTVRTNTKVADRYYKNMMKLNYVTPQFLDNKK